jgi:predicted nucleotide-binding protein
MTASYRTEIQKAVADLSAAVESQRAADRRAVVGLLKEQEALRRADFAELRRDLETVAVLTDGGLRKAQDQIVRLASLAQADMPADK